MNQDRVLVIGIGNTDCGDDGVGRFVCRKLLEKKLPHVKVIEHAGDGYSLIDAWEGIDWVIAVDAFSSGARPGQVFHLNARNHPLPTHFFHTSTHDFGIAEAVEMARTLGKLPRRLTVFGIEGKNFNVGDELSEELGPVIDGIADRIANEIQREEIRHA